MRILLALFLTTLAVPAVAGPQRGGRDHENIVRVRIERNIEQLRADVVELDRLMGLPPNRTNLRTMWELQMQIQQGIDRLDALANHIEMDPDEVCRDYRPPVVVAPPPPPPRGPAPMGPQRYQDLLRAVKSESFTSGKKP